MLFGKSMAGMFVMQKGRLRHASELLADLLGYPDARPLVGKLFWDLIHPEDRHRAPIDNRRRKSAIPAESKYLRALRKDGEIIWVDIQGEVLLLEGRPAFVGCLFNVNERQRLDTWAPDRNLKRELCRRWECQRVVGKSKPMQEICRLLEDLSDLHNAVLITGESGAGKKHIAKALHNSGCRAFEPHVVVDCSALDEDQLEYKLFGYSQGAFPGAELGRQGRFEAADGGTILLAEISEISPLIQLKLLKVLRENVVERVGEGISRKVNVRVLASTCKDLHPKVKNGEFREDLFLRLRDARIKLPPLRQRQEDIPLLAEHFLNRFNRRLGKETKGIDSEVMALLLDYHWPGNVRELEQVLEHASVHCDEPMMAIRHLPPSVQVFKGPGPKESPLEDLEVDRGFQEIMNALNKTFWNKSKAAKLIGISRQTLYRKMHEHGLL